MPSVTGRINQITQPRGGYLKPSLMKKTLLPHLNELNDISLENVHASLIGTAVDYLSRFMLTNNANEAFAISGKEARMLNFAKIIGWFGETKWF